jgi:hypothetical protein
MPLAYNGMTASPDPDEIDVIPLVVAGVSFPGGVRAGDPHTVLGWVAQQFHDNVEPLVDGWCWGYAYRQNRNADNLSVHSAGGAIDVNAPRHPNGKSGTFTSAQVRTISALLNHLQGAVVWGGDFTGTPDEMHFELCRDPARVAWAADLIRNETEGDDMPLSDDDVKRVADAVYARVHRDAVAILRGADQPSLKSAHSKLDKLLAKWGLT